MGFQIAAAVILIVFYVIYYGKVFSQKKQGVTTIQVGRDKKGPDKIIEKLMMLASVVVMLAEVASILLNASMLPSWARVLGIVLGAAGCGIFLSAILTMKDNWRAGVSSDKTDLVTGGIYAYSRNPAFLGFDLVYGGVLLLFFNWPLFLITVWTAVMFHLQIVKVEEPFLEKTFGKAYTNYKQHTGMYFGRK